MKRLFRLVIVVCIAALLLCACATQSVTTVDGVAVEFLDDGTIRYGDQTYTYSTSSKSIAIEYPNGYLYTHTLLSQSQSSGQWSYPLDAPGFVSATELGYLDEDLLVAEIQNQTGKSGFPAKMIATLLLLAAGIWLALKPRTAWYMAEGWKFKNAEPSDAALGLYRVSGVVIAVIGVLILLV